MYAVSTSTGSTAVSGALDVEEIDCRTIEAAMTAAQRKKLDPCYIMKLLYCNTYRRISSILVREELCVEDIIRTAETLIRLQLAEVDRSKPLKLESIDQVLEVLSLASQWDDTSLLNHLIGYFTAEKRSQAEKLLQRYERYLDVYYDCTMVADDPVESVEASNTQVPLEVTSLQEFNEFSKKNCRNLALCLRMVFQIPKCKMAINGARSGNSTTVLFLVNKDFIQSIMLKTCTDPVTLWVFLELRISRVRIPDLFEVNVMHLLSLQLTAALRSGLSEGADFIGVTTVSHSLAFHA